MGVYVHSVIQRIKGLVETDEICGKQQRFLNIQLVSHIVLFPCFIQFHFIRRGHDSTPDYPGTHYIVQVKQEFWIFQIW